MRTHINSNRTTNTQQLFRRRPLTEAVSLTLALSGYGLVTKRAYAALPCPVDTIFDLTIAETNAIACDITTAGILNITGTGSLTNQAGGTLRNYGALQNETGGILTNNNLLRNEAGGTLTNAGTLTNNHYIYNHGNLTNQAGGIQNNWKVWNYAGGTLTNAGTQTGVTFYSDGNLTNQAGGTLQLSWLFNGKAGTVTNAGALTTSAELSNRGSFTNEAGGSLANKGNLRNETGGKLTNAGTITNNSSMYNWGGLTNLGTLTNNGGFVNSSGGSITNAGTFTNNHYMRNFVSLTNQAGGTLTNNDFFSNYSGPLTNDGTLNNNGTLKLGAGTSFNNTSGIVNNNAGGVIELEVDLSLGDITTGTINMNSGSTLSNSAVLVNPSGHVHSNISNLTNQAGGTLRNYGALQNETGGILTNNNLLRNEAGGTLTNAGTLTNNHYIYNHGNLTNQAGGIQNNWKVWNYAGGTLTNAGTQTGVTFYSDGNLTNQAGGTLQLSWLFNGKAGTVTNAGALTTSAELSNRGSFTNEAGGSLANKGNLRNETGGKLTNAGTITNNSSMYNWGGLTNLGTLTNNGGFVNSSGGSITNAGTFTNNHYMRNFVSLTNQAGGTLTNNDFFSNYSGSLTNAGTLINNGAMKNYKGVTLNNTGTIHITTGGQVMGISSFGNFTQTGGSTIVDGLLKQGNIDIQAGTLSGSGVIQSLYSPLHIGAGASINPGSSAGSMTVTGDMNLLGSFTVEILDGVSFDLLDVAGTMDFGLGSMIDFVLDGGFTPSDGMELEFLTAGHILGFDNLGFSLSGGLLDDFGWNVLFDDTDFDLTITFFSDISPPSVPEPSSLALFGLGLPLLGWLGRRRRMSARNEPTTTPRYY